MWNWSCVLLASALAAELPQVEVDTLQGAHHSGRLVTLTSTELSLEMDDAPLTLPVAQVLEIRRTTGTDAVAVPPPPAAAAAGEITLADGSRIAGTGMTAARQQLRFVSAGLGEVSVPIKGVAHFRLAPADARLTDAWNALLEKETQKDLLIVRKGDVLDFLSGVVGEIDDKTVKFLLDRDEIPVKRERVYGIIYPKRTSTAKPVCRMDLTDGDQVQVREAQWDGNTWQVILATGLKVTLPAEAVLSLDYSLGKVRYLSQLEPRDVKYVPYFDVVWKYRRDRSLDGGPLRVGGQSYQRGLAIHSRTTLKYRLGGEYRRFQAIMGIDESVGRKGDVQVVISGDGVEKFSGKVRGDVPPAERVHALDLDVAGVRELEILVDFGGDLDIADHLDLADAKVIK